MPFLGRDMPPDTAMREAVAAAVALAQQWGRDVYLSYRYAPKNYVFGEVPSPTRSRRNAYRVEPGGQVHARHGFPPYHELFTAEEA
jgi:hypothetical protein